jgi:pyrimidine operon attenuation protein/uracil phosphoribosyltransferase
MAVDRNLMDEHKIMNAEEITRALARVAHEILERNKGTQDLVMVGIFTRGVPLAHRLARLLLEFERNQVPVAALDIGPYRDDLSDGARLPAKTDGIAVPVQDRRVVLVDDVLYTGRTVRAAMDALNDFGRPEQVQLAILLDRGHRELPIRADYVGRNVPTSRKERVHVRLREIDDREEVVVSAAGARRDAGNTRRRASGVEG